MLVSSATMSCIADAGLSTLKCPPMEARVRMVFRMKKFRQNTKMLGALVRCWDNSFDTQPMAVRNS
jgi:hypothetical protein